MPSFVLHQGNCLDVLRGMASESVQVCVTKRQVLIAFVACCFSMPVVGYATLPFGQRRPAALAALYSFQSDDETANALRESLQSPESIPLVFSLIVNKGDRKSALQRQSLWAHGPDNAVIVFRQRMDTFSIACQAIRKQFSEVLLSQIQKKFSTCRAAFCPFSAFASGTQDYLRHQLNQLDKLTEFRLINRFSWAVV
jgi:hypothetical protein